MEAYVTTFSVKPKPKETCKQCRYRKVSTPSDKASHYSIRFTLTGDITGSLRWPSRCLWQLRAPVVLVLILASRDAGAGFG